MNTVNWIARGFIGFIAPTLLAIAPVNGKDQPPPTPEQRKEVTESVQSDVDAESRDAAEKKKKAMLDEAISAVEETKKALTALEKNHKVEALAALEKATGKLEIVVSRNPKLALTPIDVEVITDDIYGSLEAIESLKDKPRATWRMGSSKGTGIAPGAGQRNRDPHHQYPTSDLSRCDQGRSAID
ncbi:MAG: YfdX family protein [Gammaproteobacteria bacterium]